MSVFIFLQPRADPADHFEVTASMSVTISKLKLNWLQNRCISYLHRSKTTEWWLTEYLNRAPLLACCSFHLRWNAQLKREIKFKIVTNSGPGKISRWRAKTHLGLFIDCRYADGRVLMSPRGMAVSNTRYLSSSETRVNAGTRWWKLHLSESTWCQESVGGICFTNQWRGHFPTPAKMQ
jgi:hypothetical protein